MIIDRLIPSQISNTTPILFQRSVCLMAIMDRWVVHTPLPTVTLPMYLFYPVISQLLLPDVVS